ncbi:MAG: DNA starvation/stationary phase protection protein [Candidatus Rokuibacteriota bacterium]|nr:MAG: DNA starvation/stationary phase protection protein [Candidatus Rokubacteria bacterium]
MSTRTRQAATAPIHGHLSRPAMGRAVPVTGQRTTDIQAVGTIAADSVKDLNQILADTMTLRDLYKKHHWQLAGGTFHQLHRLFDKHCEEQVKLIDDIAARIQALGGLSIAMAADVAETTRVPRPPRGREEAPVQLSRLLEAHEIVIREIRQAAETAADHGDDGTNDLLVSGVLRTNELHVWFLAEHLADIPVVRTD